MKRLFSIIVSLALVMGLAPSLAFGTNESDAKSTQKANQIVKEGGANPSEDSWHIGQGGGMVRTSKTIEPTGIENYFDITLTVDAKEKVANTSTAVVIVMDASNTMNANSRLANAKAAANQFIEQFCEGEGLGPDRRIGVVTFNTNAQWAVGPNLVKPILATSTPSRTR